MNRMTFSYMYMYLEGVLHVYSDVDEIVHVCVYKDV